MVSPSSETRARHAVPSNVFPSSATMAFNRDAVSRPSSTKLLDARARLASRRAAARSVSSACKRETAWATCDATTLTRCCSCDENTLGAAE
jgi:hypothetical protein